MNIPVQDQMVNIIRFALSFLIVFTIWPSFLFKSSEETPGERFFDKYAKMVALIIILCYLLISIKLYELLTLGLILLLFPLLSRLPYRDKRKRFEDKITKLNVFIYRFLDGEVKAFQGLKGKMSFKFSLKGFWKELIPNSVLLLVLVVSAYLRFNDSLHHAAPSMSDSYVTLAWMKYLEQNILFHDGIYPQGFHFYLSVLRKFAGQDPIYVLKYTGPFNGLLITFGIYLFVRRLTANPYAGIFSAFIFGVLGQYLPIGLERQAATNAQEFGLVFLVPAWHFTVSYLESRDKNAFLTALSCYAVTGLVHTLIWVFMAIGVFCFLLAYMLVSPRANFKAARHLTGAGMISGIVSGIPLLAGLLMGKKMHGSSVDFLLSSLQIDPPVLTVFDKVLGAGIGLFFLVMLIFPSLRSKMGRALSVLMLGGISLLLYLYIAPYTGNAVLTSRAGVLWSVVVSIGLGLGWGAVTYGFPRIMKGKIEPLLCFGAIVVGMVFFPPEAPAPYKMQYDCMVNQYLRLSKEYTPTTWMMVSSEEGYDLALGKSWHMHLKEFAENYSPWTEKIYRKDNQAVLEIQNIFIFIEKKMLRPPFKEMETILSQRDYYYKALGNWVKEYGKCHNNIQLYYEDDLIQVYHIRQVDEKQESLAEIWGVSK
ncbi:MAG: hypothetical protein GX434_07515 [Peptococcaceae bacterium]|nr:hypothetical protein [Peptococcaceae bacterium]